MQSSHASSFTSVVLEAQNLSMHFGGVVALNEVNLRLCKNELRCLIGPNGAGKSTFFRCVSGQYVPTRGSVLIGDEICSGLPMHDIARKGIGLKTQVPSLMNRLSVKENLWLGARSKSSRSKSEVYRQIDKVLEKVPLKSLLHQTTGMLSHGQRQLVEMAVVLSADPWLLLLDEPAGGLTHAEVVSMAQLIKSLQQAMTIVVVEHDMNFVRQLNSQVTVFNQGEVLTEGPVNEVLNDDRVRSVYLGRKAV